MNIAIWEISIIISLSVVFFLILRKLPQASILLNTTIQKLPNQIINTKQTQEKTDSELINKKISEIQQLIEINRSLSPF